MWSAAVDDAKREAAEQSALAVQQGEEPDAGAGQRALVPHRERSTSPTMVVFGRRQAAAQRQMVQTMKQVGVQIFNPEWNLAGFEVQGGDVVKAVTIHSPTVKSCTLKLYGTDQQLTIPVQVCTKVGNVREAMANNAQVNPDQLRFTVRQGCNTKTLMDHDELARNITVHGIKFFTAQPHKWAHPTIFIGCGLQGVRHAMFYVNDGNRDFIMYDRYNRVGGHAWLVQANKTSKLQTEFSAFHPWLGPEWWNKPEMGYPEDLDQWPTWPKKDKVLESFEFCVKHCGIYPHIHFETNVMSMEIVGNPWARERSYQFKVEDWKEKREPWMQSGSVLYHISGAYVHARVINYPGEDSFDGYVGYGMNDDIPYDHIEGAGCAILGNGAFAVENIRTSMEYGANKVYVICRKKNLPSPRMCCWFVHQAIVPVPAAMLVDTFVPMFTECGMGDPWEYHSIYATKDRAKCTISSNSRFGIGDVTFLAVATGRCEYVADYIKRFSRHTIHMEKGRKLEDVTVIIKCLGLIANHATDKFHRIKQMIGAYPDGDYRRHISADPVGMHAQNFGSFGADRFYPHGHSMVYIMKYPFEMERAINNGLLDMLPRNKKVEDHPLHTYDIQYAMNAGIILGAFIPKQGQGSEMHDINLHECFQRCIPFDKYHADCVESWDQYQRDWNNQGHKHEYVPYPHTREIVMGWFERYKKEVGPTSRAEWDEWIQYRMGTHPSQQQQGEQEQKPAEDDMSIWQDDAAQAWWQGKS